MARAFAAAVFAATLAACAGGGPYRKFYRAVEGAPAAFAPCAGAPRVVAGSDPQSDGKDLEKQGYAVVGYASFNAAVPDPAGDPDLLAQASAIGACRVILSSNRSGSKAVGFGGARHDEPTYEVSAIFFRKRAGKL